LHIHIRIFAYSSTSYGTPNIYKCFRFPVLLNTTDILLGILFDYTTLHRVTIIMPPPVGGGALSGDRRLSSVCLSDVAYIGSNSKTKRPRKTKLCTGYPRSHATPTPTSRPKGQKSRSRGGAYCGGHLAAQLVTHCNVARSRHWLRQVTALCNVACGSRITTMNSPSGSTLQCDTWL